MAKNIDKPTTNIASDGPIPHLSPHMPAPQVTALSSDPKVAALQLEQAAKSYTGQFPASTQLDPTSLQSPTDVLAANLRPSGNTDPSAIRDAIQAAAHRSYDGFEASAQNSTPHGDIESAAVSSQMQRDRSHYPSMPSQEVLESFTSQQAPPTPISASDRDAVSARVSTDSGWPTPKPLSTAKAAGDQDDSTEDDPDTSDGGDATAEPSDDDSSDASDDAPYTLDYSVSGNAANGERSQITQPDNQFN
jgi:hypothetical protein